VAASDTFSQVERRGSVVLSVRSCLLAAVACVVALSASSPAQAVSPDIVISQVYGGGGNSGAMYTHDFVELF
jgi:hypothetical protein